METSINEIITKLKGLEKEVEETLAKLKYRSETVTKGDLEDAISALEKKFDERLKDISTKLRTSTDRLYASIDGSKFAPYDRS